MEHFGSTVPFAEPAWYRGYSSPFYTQSHRRLRDFVRQYVDKNLIPHAEEWEAAGKVPDEVFQEFARLGFVAASMNSQMTAEYLSARPVTSTSRAFEAQSLPANIPPTEWDIFHSLIVGDEFSRTGYLGVCWGLNGGNAIGVPPILNHGTKDQKDRFIPAVLRGQLRGCLGITEPDAGSDVANLGTTAILSQDGKCYIVNGAKKWITNALWSDFVTAAVRTGGPDSGAAGLSALIIPLTARGVTRRRMYNSGVSASGSTYIEFDEVEVPVENLIGGPAGVGQGFRMVMTNFNHERLMLATQSLRCSRICFEDAYAYAQRRETFGKPLISNQLIKNKLGNMSMLIEAVQAQIEILLHHAKANPGALDSFMGGDFARIKVHAGRTLELCVREAQQIMGGLGYARGGRGGRVEQISRDVRVLVVGGGSDEILTDLSVKQAIASEELLKARLQKAAESKL